MTTCGAAQTVRSEAPAGACGSDEPARGARSSWSNVGGLPAPLNEEVVSRNAVRDRAAASGSLPVNDCSGCARLLRPLSPVPAGRELGAFRARVRTACPEDIPQRSWRCPQAAHPHPICVAD